MAVSVALCPLGMLPAVALNEAVWEPASTARVAGTGSSGVLLVSESDTPPAGAAWLRFAVQVALAPEVRLVGLQDKEDSVIADTKLMAAVWEAPARVAVRFAF